jgi:hypothetical protein
MLELVKGNEREHVLPGEPTPELQHRPRNHELAGRAWEAIERAEQHMATSAQRLDRSQALLQSGAQRVRWVAQRVDGNGTRARAVGPPTVDDRPAVDDRQQ